MKRLSPALIAPSLDMSRQEVEAWIRTGTCPFGVYIRKEGCIQGHYEIFKERYEKYLTGADMVTPINDQSA